MWIVSIRTEPIPHSQFGVCLGHDLHQTDGTGGRSSVGKATAFRLHHGTHPRFWPAEPPGCLRYIGGPTLDFRRIILGRNSGAQANRRTAIVERPERNEQLRSEAERTGSKDG